MLLFPLAALTTISKQKIVLIELVKLGKPSRLPFSHARETNSSCFFRDVTVIKLITRNSIDDDMYNLAQNKLSLEREVSSGVDTKQANISEADAGVGGKEVASKMRSSLLKNLQTRFAAEESQAASQSQKPAA
jgi:hypothetical protein